MIQNDVGALTLIAASVLVALCVIGLLFWGRISNGD